MQLGKKVYLANRISEDNAEIEQFNEPKEYITKLRYLTIIAASSLGSYGILLFGEKVSNYWRGQADPRVFADLIKVGDRMYVDGLEPNKEDEEEYGFGYTANAKVTAVAFINHGMQFTLERISNS